MIELEPMEIVAIRHKRGMTQPEFARFIGIHRTTLNRWERGKKKPEPIYLANLILCRDTGRSVMQTILPDIRRDALSKRERGSRERYGIALEEN